jgi:hypothetical protein
MLNFYDLCLFCSVHFSLPTGCSRSMMLCPVLVSVFERVCAAPHTSSRLASLLRIEVFWYWIVATPIRVCISACLFHTLPSWFLYFLASMLPTILFICQCQFKQNIALCGILFIKNRPLFPDPIYLISFLYIHVDAFSLNF